MAAHRFKKGKSGNPRGRAPRAVEDAKRMVLLAVFDEKAEREVTLKMIAAAKKGRVSAARLLFEYKYGKPLQSLDLGNKDGQPLSVQVLLQRARAATE